MERVHGTVFRTHSGREMLAVHMALPPLADDSDKSWVQIIPGEGKFEGHPEGAFEFNQEVIGAIVENFDKKTTPVKVDYEHDSHKYDVLGPKVSSGHVLELQQRDGPEGAQLWAYVEWTEQAAGFIRAKEYNYNSPVIAFEYDDPVTGDDQGPTLLSLALTDTPFIDGQKPIQLSLFAAHGGSQEDRMPKLKMSAVEALAKAQQKLDSSAGREEVISQVFDELDMQQSRDVVREVVAELQNEGVTPMADAPTEEEKPVPMEGVTPEDETVSMQDEMAPETASDFTPVLEQLMTATGADRAALIAALGEMVDDIAKMVNDSLSSDGAPAEMPVSDKDAADLQADALAAQVKQLSQAVGVLTRSNANREAADKAEREAANAARVAKMVDDGFIHAHKKAVALSLLNSDPKRFEAIYDGTTKVVPVDESQASGDDIPGGKVAPASVVQLSDLTPAEQHRARMFANSNLRGGDLNKCIAEVVAERSN